MCFLGQLFEFDIVNINKEVLKEAFVYSCYNKKGGLVISYKIDWENYRVIYSNYDTQITKVYSSDNLYDKANTRGMLEIEKKIINE